MKFELDEKSLDRIAEWNIGQEEIVKSRQNSETPYYGAIGGELTYKFTPTNLGLVITVKHGFTLNELDLTDYDSW